MDKARDGSFSRSIVFAALKISIMFFSNPRNFFVPSIVYLVGHYFRTNLKKDSFRVEGGEKYGELVTRQKSTYG